MKWLFSPRAYFDGPGAVGMLFLRMVFGFGLALHGMGKIQTPFSWMGKMGEGIPGPLQALAALSEFGGGLALAFGFFTPLACFGIMSTMFVAILVHLTNADTPTYFIKPSGAKTGDSYESALTYFAVALCVFLTGPGVLSLDVFTLRRFFGRNVE